MNKCSVLVGFRLIRFLLKPKKELKHQLMCRSKSNLKIESRKKVQIVLEKNHLKLNFPYKNFNLKIFYEKTLLFVEFKEHCFVSYLLNVWKINHSYSYRVGKNHFLATSPILSNNFGLKCHLKIFLTPKWNSCRKKNIYRFCVFDFYGLLFHSQFWMSTMST